MSELQNEESTIEFDSEEIENQEIGSELATDNDGEHEEKPQVDDEIAKQEAVQKTINEKVFKQRQAERERDEFKAKVEAYERKQREEQEMLLQNVPPLPDPFDENYEEKIAQRDSILAKKAQYEWEQQFQQKQSQQQQEQAQRAKLEELQQKAVSYSARAKELGINQNELQEAANKVAQYQLNDDLVMEILSDKNGALITKYLAANPNDGYELATLSPYKQGVYLEQIKAKAGALKPKKTNAPEPPTHIKGSTVDVDSKRFTHSKGATFS